MVSAHKSTLYNSQASPEGPPFGSGTYKNWQKNHGPKSAKNRLGPFTITLVPQGNKNRLGAGLRNLREPRLTRPGVFKDRSAGRTRPVVAQLLEDVSELAQMPDGIFWGEATIKTPSLINLSGP